MAVAGAVLGVASDGHGTSDGTCVPVNGAVAFVSSKKKLGVAEGFLGSKTITCGRAWAPIANNETAAATTAAAAAEKVNCIVN